MAESTAPEHHLIFFITGNPGFSAYYGTFLSTLGELLSSRQASSKVYHIHTQDLAGFGNYDDGNLYDLERQIQILYETLVGMSISTGPRTGQSYDSVILIGHSVGSYILLEILSRLRRFSQRPESDEVKMKASTVQANTGILLFPTVTHIAKSPSGVKISTLFRIPHFPKIASTMAKALIWPIPRGILRRLVGIVTGMPSAAAEVTTNFLKSSTGIHQALFLAQDEMQTITEDKWDEEIWGLEHTEADTKSSVPKLIFYFGQNDHWVADHTRDQLIAARGQRGEESQNSKPLMLIDEDGVDHGFCIKHSESIAEKVAVWIEDIAESS